MGIFDWLKGSSPADVAASTAGAVVEGLDSLFTSDDERAKWEHLRAKLEQEPHLLQALTNKVEAAHPSTFVAGWRPALGWTCAAGLFFFYPARFAVGGAIWARQAWAYLEAAEASPDFATVALQLPAFPFEAGDLVQLVLALLGLAGLRTVEKFQGVARNK